jgi:hypothetical protein
MKFRMEKRRLTQTVILRFRLFPKNQRETIISEKMPITFILFMPKLPIQKAKRNKVNSL